MAIDTGFDSVSIPPALPQAPLPHADTPSSPADAAASGSPRSGAAPNPYAELFYTYVEQSVAQSLREVRAAHPLVPVPVRQQAWHLLSYALRLPQAWPGTRDLLLALAPKMEQEGLRDEWIPYLEQGVEQSRAQEDTRTEAELSLHVGYLYTLRGKFDVARRWLGESLSRFEALNDKNGQGTALNRLAAVARRQQQHPSARRFIQRAQTHLHEDSPERANSFVVLGEIALDERDWARAENCFRQALQIWQSQADVRRIAWGLRNLGPTLVEQEKYEEAEAHYSQAIHLLETLQDSVNLAITQMNLGILYSQTGQSHKALALYKQAESIFRQAGNDSSLAMVYNNMAIEYREQEQWDAAERACLMSLTLWRQLDDIGAQLNVLDELGLVYLGKKNFVQATSTFQEALLELSKVKLHPGYERLLELLTAHLQESLKKSRAHSE